MLPAAVNMLRQWVHGGNRRELTKDAGIDMEIIPEYR